MKTRKNKLTNLLKIGILFFGFSILLWNCQKEEIIQAIDTSLYKTVTKNESSNFLTSSLKLAKGNSNYLSYDIAKISLEKITNSNAKLTVIPARTKHGKIYSRILLLKINDTIKSVVYHMYSNKTQQTNKFSGLVTLTDIDGNILKAFKYLNGIRTKSYKLSNYHSKSNTDCDRDVCGHDYEDPFCICNIQRLNEVEVKVRKHGIEYISLADLYGNEGSDDNGCEVGCNDWNDFGGGGSGLYDNIKNKLTNKCAKGIFTELENGLYKDHPLKPEVQIPNNIDKLNFSESILKMFNDSDKTHYTIQNGVTNNSNASTDPTTNITTISDIYLQNATRLSIARTMIHESVHAYINSTIKRLPGFVNMSFLQRMQAYAKQNGITDTSRFHHEFMGQYVNGMAYSLYQWDKRYGSGGYFGWDYYKAMAYAGLSYVKKDAQGNPVLDNNGNPIHVDTDSFKELEPNKTDRDNIKKINSNEATGKNAKGTKC